MASSPSRWLNASASGLTLHTVFVTGLSSPTRELGRLAISQQRGTPTDKLSTPVDLPAPSCAPSASDGLLATLCSCAGSLVHHTLVALTVGLYGRQADGSYVRPRGNGAPTRSYEQLLDA